ncbi:MAG TPA: hypothetical protein VGO47_10350 [Chlamydiales bacterium]|nr:hypothetical protein [Chlamydiales bacterium]
MHLTPRNVNVNSLTGSTTRKTTTPTQDGHRAKARSVPIQEAEVNNETPRSRSLAQADKPDAERSPVILAQEAYQDIDNDPDRDTDQDDNNDGRKAPAART